MISAVRAGRATRRVKAAAVPSVDTHNKPLPRKRRKGPRADANLARHQHKGPHRLATSGGASEGEGAGTFGMRRSMGTARTALCLPPCEETASSASSASRMQTKSFESLPRTATTAPESPCAFASLLSSASTSVPAREGAEPAGRRLQDCKSRALSLTAPRASLPPSSPAVAIFLSSSASITACKK